MKSSQKNLILFFVFIIFAFILFFPQTSLAGCPAECTIHSNPGPGLAGCCTAKQVIYCTECNECFTVGSCCSECCKWDADDRCIEWCCDCQAGAKWTEYKCASEDCSGTVLTRECRSYVGCGPCPATCVDDCVCVECTDWRTCDTCQDWQKPIGRPCQPCTLTGLCKPECVCDKDCLEAPTNPKYHKNMIYPHDECYAELAYQMDWDDVYLPVKLDWDDIKGWRQHWTEGGCPQVLDCQGGYGCCESKDCYAGAKACYEAPSDPAFGAKSDKLKECKIVCRRKCLPKIAKATILGGYGYEYWLSPYKIPELYRNCIKECEDGCQKQNETTAASCPRICPKENPALDPWEKYEAGEPMEEGGPAVDDKCYLQPDGCAPWHEIGYAQSYEIKIEGEMRDPKALEEINRLTNLMEKERKKAQPDFTKIEQWKKEIERIRKEELEIGEYIDFLDKSEFIPVSCLLKSNRPYKWRARACCPCKEDLAAMSEEDRDEVCGDWSEEWEFITTPAPEPKLPYDPDWAGDEIGREVPQAEIEKLKWCEIDDPELYRRRTRLELDKIFHRPLSYKLLAYYSKDRINIDDLCHPNLYVRNECVSMRLSETGDDLVPPYEFWDRNNNYFTKITPYAWEVTACVDIGGMNCPYEGTTYYSQLWRFEAEDFVLTEPSLLSPGDDRDGKNPLGLPILLRWSSPYAMSWKYEISDGKGIRDHNTQSLTLDFPQLKLNTLYSWKVQPCWDFESKKCENFWAGPWYFITTGRKPELYYPKNNDIPIPINFHWEDVPGAKSYIFKIQGDEINIETAVEKSDFSLDYPDLKQEKTYSWQVKTCAKDKDHSCVKDQSCCGEWEGPIAFTTFKLEQPSIDKPESEGEVYTYEPRHVVSWQEVSGARFYQYGVIFSSSIPQDLRQECQELEGKTIAEGITERTSIDLLLKCWGEYQWQVTACLDENCQETGQEGDIWSFNLVAKEAPPEKHGWGLVPCGRDDYDPTTPWYEDEPCGIKHIFIMLYIILNFFLWKVIPIILVLLVLASGAIFYFSVQTAEVDPLAKVKSLWKAAGLGLAVIFLAWIIISLFLAIIGYRVGVLGPWWQI